MSKSSGKKGHSKSVSPIDIQRHLKGVDYPASKRELIERARSQNADEEVMQVLEQMPDHEYQSPADVMKGYGEVGGHHAKGRSAS